MSHGETCPLGFRMYLSFYYSSTILSHPAPPGLTLGPTWFCCLWCSLVPLPGSPVRTMGGAMVVPQGHLGMSMLLLPSMSPIFVLKPAFYSFKERSTDMCNVVPNPIIWNFSPLIWVHCVAQEVRGV